MPSGDELLVGEVFTINQIRSDLELAPIEDGDDLLVYTDKGIYPKDNEELYQVLFDEES